MKRKSLAFARVREVACAAALSLVVPAAGSVTLRVADQGDALSMDPHSLNEAINLSVTANVYESLLVRNAQFKLEPRLATSWKQTSPTVWRFNLRKGVRFHDGTPFTADDVLFSLERTRAEGSDMKTAVSAIREILRLDDHTIDIVTAAPYPILPERLSNWMIMSRRWCEAVNAVGPVDRRKGTENAASFRANGTGPYRLRERQPNVRTTFVRHHDYWGKIEGNVDEVIFMPIANDATRVAAMLSGEVDVMEPVPVQDVERVRASAGHRLWQGGENRIIFLGMDQKRDELLFSNVKGRNPFKDRRVRQAFYQAIDVDAIRARIMRGTSVPTALMIAPQVRGYAPDLAKRLPHDVEGAKKLLSDAGYGSGFELKMNCPNDRYVADGQICQAVTAALARIGVKVALEAETKGVFFTKVLRRDTSFYMYGWTPSTADAHDTLFSVLSTPGDLGRGQANLGSYSNPKVDALTDAVGSETDDAKRDAMVREAMKLHQDDIGHIPLHQQPLLWASRKNIELAQLPSNNMPWRYVRFK